MHPLDQEAPSVIHINIDRVGPFDARHTPTLEAIEPGKPTEQRGGNTQSERTSETHATYDNKDFFCVIF